MNVIYSRGMILMELLLGSLPLFLLVIWFLIDRLIEEGRADGLRMAIDAISQEYAEVGGDRFPNRVRELKEDTARVAKSRFPSKEKTSSLLYGLECIARATASAIWDTAYSRGRLTEMPRPEVIRVDLQVTELAALVSAASRSFYDGVTTRTDAENELLNSVLADLEERLPGHDNRSTERALYAAGQGRNSPLTALTRAFA